MYFSLNFIAMKKDNLIMGLNQIELLSIEDTKRKRISFTGVSRLSLIIIVFQRLCANCIQGVSACKKKAATRLFVTAWFSLFCILWTSLGLNQGPPDYESVALTNWATSPCHNFLLAGAKVVYSLETCKIYRPNFDKKI